MIVVRYPLVRRRAPWQTLTLQEASEAAGLHPVVVERFVDFGLLEPAERAGVEMRFDASCLKRLLAISRLRRDLGVNLQGIGVILDLVDRLEALERELEWRRGRG
jgi:MerR family transcriptional regulator/heat shock protein HspR